MNLYSIKQTYASQAKTKRPSAVYAEPFIPTASLQGKDSPTPYDLDRALLEAAEEMKFNWPELAPVERKMARIMEIALGLLLFAALIAFCCLG